MKEYLKQIGTLPRSVKFFIFTEIILGLGAGIWNLNFNFFLLSKGMLEDKIGLVVSVGTFANAIFAVAAGALGDRFGFKRCMLAGFLLKTLAATGTVLAGPIGFLYAFRILGGAGDCIVAVCAYPYITALAQEKDRNMVFGLLFSISMLSQFFGNIASGFLSGSFHSYGILLLISTAVTFLVGALRFLLPTTASSVKVERFRFYWPRAGFIRVYLIYELLGYCGYFMAYSMLNLICKNRFGLSDGITGLISGVMTLVSGTAIFIIPAISDKFGRARMNTAIILCLVFLYVVMSLAGGPVFLVLAVVTAAMQCMMGGLIDGPMLGKVSEQERGGFSGLKLLLQNTGTGSGIFLAGILLKGGSSLSFLYLAVCLLTILQLVLFTSGVRKHIAKE